MKKIVTDKNCIVFTPALDVTYATWSGSCLNNLGNGRGILKLYIDSELVVTYDGELFNGKREGLCTLIYPNGWKKTGHYKDDFLNGEVLEISPEGKKYFEGQYKDGEREGFGILMEEEYVYKGSWKANNINGIGTITYADGRKYEGEWRDNKSHGKGKLTLVDGSTYEGDFKNGLKEGIGKFTSMGMIFEGEFVNDEAIGITGNSVSTVTITHLNGEKYVGEIIGSIYNGKGKFIYSNGDSYEGEWMGGEKVGQGTFTYSDGSIYEGTFNAGKREGQGVYTHNDGTKYQGEWKDDKKSGFGTEIYIDGDQYVGQWIEGKREGQGVYTHNNGSKYQGEWKDDKKSGFGTEKYFFGDQYVGQWIEGEREGQGIYTFNSGAKMDGIWKDNNFIQNLNQQSTDEEVKRKKAELTDQEKRNGTNEITKEINNILGGIFNEMVDGATGEWEKNPKNCHYCKGNGVVSVCPLCEKRGKILCKKCKGKKVLYDGTVCIQCYGSGIQTCSGCNGKIYNIKCQHTIWQFQK